MTPVPHFHLPPEAEISTLVMADGAEIRTCYIPALAARGSFLVLSGRADFLEKWAEPFRWLREMGLNIAAFDWRGQGLSSRGAAGQAGHISSFELWLQDLDQISRWSAEVIGKPPDYILGHSMGGHLLMRWLADRSYAGHALQQKLKGIALVAPLVRLGMAPLVERLARVVARRAVAHGKGEEYAWGQGPVSPLLAEGRGKRLYGRLQHSKMRQQRLTSAQALFEDEQRWLASVPSLATGGVTWGWLDAYWKSEKILDAVPVAGFTVPALALLGSKDKVVSTEAVRSFARQHGNMHCETIPGGAHELLREGPPMRENAYRALQQFLT